jgi:hypothetical protein
MYINDFAENNNDVLRLYATDGAGLTISVEYDLHVTDSDESRLVITDECSEGNFAIMYPTKGNMRSLSACMRVGMNNIIENAED